MMRKYLMLFFFIRQSFEVDWKCPDGPKSPQLSTTFLDGLWYELLQTNNYLNNDTCSHFRISCFNSTCEILNVKWESYILQPIYKGILEQQDGKVHLNITEADEPKEIDVNIKFDQRAVLIWHCDDVKTDFFASLLMRMDSEEEMEATWLEAEKYNFPAIIEGFPAEIWHKGNFTACSNALGIRSALINNFFIISALIIISIMNM